MWLLRIEAGLFSNKAAFQKSGRLDGQILKRDRLLQGAVDRGVETVRLAQSPDDRRRVPKPHAIASSLK